MLGEEILPEYPEHSREISQMIAEKIEVVMLEAVSISLLIDELATSEDRKNPKVINPEGEGRLSSCEHPESWTRSSVAGDFPWRA